MTTHKNALLAKRLGVAPSTITLWIQNSVEGKNNLQLEESKGKFRIIDNAHNEAEMNRLRESNRKYISDQWMEEVEPDPKFYEIFSEDEIVEIINSLKTKREIPMKFCYKNVGATIWDDHINNNVKEGNYSFTSEDVSLLDNIFEYIQTKTGKYEKINIIDIGPGNAMPVKKLIKSLIEINKFGKYVAIDISPEMLNIAINNLRQEFPDIEIEGYIRDIEKQDIADILMKTKDTNSINICLLLGGTIGNFQHRESVWKNFKCSLDNNDYLFISNFLDTHPEIKVSVRIFNLKEVRQMWFWIPSLLKLFDESNIKVYTRFDEIKDSKIYYFVTEKEYNLKFKLKDKIIKVNINKGVEITNFRSKLHSIESLIHEIIHSGHNLIQFTTYDSHYLMIIQPMLEY